jgi:hypothetical protein
VVGWLGMLAEERAWRGAAMAADRLGTRTRGGGVLIGSSLARVTKDDELRPLYGARGRRAADGPLGRAARVRPWYGTDATPVRGSSQASSVAGHGSAWGRCVDSGGRWPREARR